MQNAQYCPPWANTSIVGIAGSSGSGKTSLANAIVTSLNLPWVVILSMDSFYKVLTAEQLRKAFVNEYDFDSPDAVDFDLLLQRLQDLKDGKRAEIPIWSFEHHTRLDKTHIIYSPHVLILEGIFALHDTRVREMLDLKIFAEADSDLCLSRRRGVQPDPTMAWAELMSLNPVVRDVRERGRDVEGCIKQWFSFVKPNFRKYVEVQREVSDILVPRGVHNVVAISMVIDRIRKILAIKSKLHQVELQRLEQTFEGMPLSPNVIALEQTPQLVGINTILLDPKTERADFIFYFDRLVTILIEKATEKNHFSQKTVTTQTGTHYYGLGFSGSTSAVVLLRGGSIMERALRRVLPDCLTGRLLVQTSDRTGEPELHFNYLPEDISNHSRVLLLDPQMSSGGAALMAVRVLVDHGVDEENITFITYFAGKRGLSRLMAVFPGISVVVCRIGQDLEERWLEAKYLGC